ncbi:hypothetical protein N9L33_05535 [Nitrospinae bacterium]|nr:hypothetical protein [Nitrospinota bacterium]
MKRITRLSLALIMFSLFSISYLVTSAIAQTSTTPTGTPGVPPTGVAPAGTPGMPPTGMAPAGNPGMPPTGMAPAGTPGMPPTGMAPTGTPATGSGPADTSESGGISNWIKGGLKALGIGSEPVENPAGLPATGAPGS